MQSITRILLAIVLSICCFVASAEVPGIWLAIFNSNDIYDQTIIAFDSAAADGYDQFDAHKRRDSSEVYLYTILDTSLCSLQALPFLSNDKTITIGIDASVAGMHLIRLVKTQELDESVAIVLEDAYSSTRVNLRRTPDYWFNTLAGTGMQRFRLHLNAPVQVTTVDGRCDGTESQLQIIQPGTYLWNYEIKDASNTLVDSGSDFNGTKTLTELPTGTYTISLTDQFGYSFEKQASLTDKEAVVARFQVSDSVVSANSPVYFFDYSIGASDYIWDFGDGNIRSGTPFPQNIFVQPGVYRVTFTASNDECADVSEKIIEVLDHATGMADHDSPVMRMYSFGNEMFIEFPASRSGMAQIEVYNAIGQVIIKDAISASGKQKILLPEDHGFCLVKVVHREKCYNGIVFSGGR